MSKALVMTRMALGGIVCGIFLGALCGGLVGLCLGLVTGHLAAGLDGALLAALTLGLGGGLLGLLLGYRDTHEDDSVRVQQRDYERFAMPGSRAPGHDLGT